MSIRDANGREFQVGDTFRMKGTVSRIMNDGPVGVEIEIERGRMGKIWRILVSAECIETAPTNS